jgi:transaldolase/glucose-6-phosphate isomerase
MNALKKLNALGQSLWLDYIDRQLLSSGTLHRLISEDDLKGLTSNPAIFEKAVATDGAYAGDLKAGTGEPQDAEKIFERLAIADIQAAADILYPVYEHTIHRDGYVSLEVSPKLAYDAEGTILEARRLWRAVQRENLMIKVPATAQGIPAITALLSEGININATLLFSRTMYGRVTEAWLAGLEQFALQGGRLDKLASVASFFVSRVDSAVDPMILARIKQTEDPALQAALHNLLGQAAIANAKLAYHQYRQVVDGARWRALAKKGAQTQRLLWASTGTKNPAYSDILYVEALIGPDTVNTVPPATLKAFADHGVAHATLEEGLEQARATESSLQDLGISMEEVTRKLLTEGVELFADAYAKLLKAIMSHTQP